LSKFKNISVGVASLVLLCGANATAQTVSAKADHPAHDLSLTIAPHVGVLVPQLFSELGAWPVFGLELGYILPFDAGSMVRPLEITADVMFTMPSASGTDFSPAFGESGEDYDWELVERTVVVELAVLWRFMPPGQGFSVYGQLGPRLYLTESVMTASSASGADLGENRETKTEVGFMVGGGAEYAVGPGSIFGALEFGWSDLNKRITGDSNTGALVLDLGYRLMF